MKSDINGCSSCQAGTESYETYFAGRAYPKQKLYQYDFRTDAGKLFSTVKRSLEECRAARDKWLENS